MSIIHNVLSSPEFTAGLITLVLGGLSVIAAAFGRWARKLNSTVEATHEQVNNAHTTNLRDDLDKTQRDVDVIKDQVREMNQQQDGMVTMLKEMATRQTEHMREMNQRFTSLDNRIDREETDRQALNERLHAELVRRRD